jgi:hypothetical protein
MLTIKQPRGIQLCICMIAFAALVTVLPAINHAKHNNNKPESLTATRQLQRYSLGQGANELMDKQITRASTAMHAIAMQSTRTSSARDTTDTATRTVATTTTPTATPISSRIASNAEEFIGTPFDPDPQGLYVTKKVIVADDAVDCMYLVFRSTELAFATTPKQAIEVALDKRFIDRGIIKKNQVVNYDNRFQYGEDMITSGKWGKEITAQIGATLRIVGTRGQPHWEVLPLDTLAQSTNKLRSGDLLFFVNNPQKRSVAKESVGHMGIVKMERQKAFFIHAHGKKNHGGIVAKTLLTDYIQWCRDSSKCRFIGAQVTRFD